MGLLDSNESTQRIIRLTQVARNPSIVTMTSWTPDLRGRKGPVYLAIAEALAEDAAGGRVPSGARLPTHRELALRLGVTVGTVTRAYAEAARRGLVTGEVGRGTFACGSPTPFGEGESPAGAFVDLSLNHPPPLGESRGGALSRALLALSQRRDFRALLDYSPDGGAPAHRAAGAAYIGLTGLSARAEQVLVSSGSQHALTAVLTALAQPGDVVLTENLTYPGMKALGALLHLRLQGLAMDEKGLRPDALESACRTSAAKLVYLIPTIHNPTGVVMPEERRREIARIVRAHDLVVIEDDVHGLLAEAAPAPLAAFAADRTCYVAGTAKTLAPGLRTSFVLAPPQFVGRIASGIRATAWMAAPLTAEIVAQWVADGTAEAIVKRRREEARARQKLAASALGGFHYDAHPTSNHLWLHLPDPWRSEGFADEARRRGVGVTPSQAFLVGRGTAPHAVRVCLGAARDRSELERSLVTLAGVLAGPGQSGPVIV